MKAAAGTRDRKTNRVAFKIERLRHVGTWESSWSCGDILPPSQLSHLAHWLRLEAGLPHMTVKMAARARLPVVATLEKD